MTVREFVEKYNVPLVTVKAALRMSQHYSFYLDLCETQRDETEMVLKVSEYALNQMQDGLKKAERANEILKQLSTKAES